MPELLAILPRSLSLEHGKLLWSACLTAIPLVPSILASASWCLVEYSAHGPFYPQGAATAKSVLLSGDDPKSAFCDPQVFYLREYRDISYPHGPIEPRAGGLSLKCKTACKRQHTRPTEIRKRWDSGTQLIVIIFVSVHVAASNLVAFCATREINKCFDGNISALHAESVFPGCAHQPSVTVIPRLKCFWVLVPSSYLLQAFSLVQHGGSSREKEVLPGSLLTHNRACPIRSIIIDRCCGVHYCTPEGTSCRSILYMASFDSGVCATRSGLKCGLFHRQRVGYLVLPNELPRV